MAFKLLPSHSCVRNQIKKLNKKYNNLDNHLSEIFTSLEQDPHQGDRYPGFGENEVRKLRVQLKAQKIGKSGGLRLIFMVLNHQEIIIRIAIYAERDWSKESNIKEMITGNLKTILHELDQTTFLEE